MIGRQFGALSGVAMTLVVLNHAITLGLAGPGLAGEPPPAGVWAGLLTILQQLGIVFAVPTFFFISGCFAAYASQSGSLAQTYRTTFSRLRGILLPYLLWSVVFYALLAAQQLSGHPYPWLQSYSLPDHVKHLIVGYPYHFVPLLVFWYLLSPLLARADTVRHGRRYGVWILLAIAAYQVALLDLHYPAMFGAQLPASLRVLIPPVIGRPLADWAIWFPLGLIYSLNARSAAARLRRVAWALLAATVALFIVVCLHELGFIRFPLARILCPLAFVGLLPLIPRSAIPLAGAFEWIGKRSYGFYLTHLVAINLAIMLLMAVAPAMLAAQAVIQPLLFAVGMGGPALLMAGAARLPVRAAWRYVFG